MKSQLRKAKRIVVKIGSSLLVDNERAEIREDWLDSLACDLSRFRARGQEIMVVSSGAIALGRKKSGLLSTRNLRLEESQAAAAVGQILLAHAYQHILERHNLNIAQILLTLEDTEHRRKHLNARNTLNQLLKIGVVPVINENDTVATSEIRFGDNDRLAARVAAMTSTDCLILLSDIDGLYDSDPRQNPRASHIAEVSEITEDIKAMAGAAPAGYSSGGMITKLDAANIAMDGGCDMVITDGKCIEPLSVLMRGGRATWFNATSSPRKARKRWIAGMVKTSGEITVDKGAAEALSKGKSLLPAGITRIIGNFARGDAVLVRNSAGHEIARGLTAYSALETEKIKGQRSDSIESILGYRGGNEVLHRDNLAVKRPIPKSS